MMKICLKFFCLNYRQMNNKIQQVILKENHLNIYYNNPTKNNKMNSM